MVHAIQAGIIGVMCALIIYAGYYILQQIKKSVNKDLKRPSDEIEKITAREIIQVQKKRTSRNFRSLSQPWRRGLIAGTLLAILIGAAAGNGHGWQDNTIGGAFLGAIIYWIVVLIGCWVAAPEEKATTTVSEKSVSEKSKQSSIRSYSDQQVADMIRREKLNQHKKN